MAQSHTLYGIESDDIDELALSIACATGIKLHAIQSPMEGRWYSSVSPSERRSLLTAAQPYQALGTTTSLTLRPNDPGDIYYGNAMHPGKGKYLLEVRGQAAATRQVEANLIRASIELITIKSDE